MNINMEVRTLDENAFSGVNISAATPENVSVEMKGPVIERSADISEALFAFLISIGASVPANLIANWITNLIVSQFKPKAETVTITIKGGDPSDPNEATVTLDRLILNDLQLENVLAKELTIQIEKIR